MDWPSVYTAYRKTDPVHGITVDSFSKKIKGDPDRIQLVPVGPRLHCYGSLFDPYQK